jgi:hypothetical protein
VCVGLMGVWVESLFFGFFFGCGESVGFGDLVWMDGFGWRCAWFFLVLPRGVSRLS